ncbi:hypothetical protein CA13_00060 [Planctomycetes bacterium CA13]|uniref:Uncharacterized protein n=1 Tax=Novipirellula herctigrandis TaxID=2527986 RepID=A0A5C5YUW1_9BACT|nr:hypothetical protein CA13_00060 [Planctomycetes bacterium CA13]
MLSCTARGILKLKAVRTSSESFDSMINSYRRISMGCYGAVVERFSVCLHVNLRRPQNPAVVRLGTSVIPRIP